MPYSLEELRQIAYSPKPQAEQIDISESGKNVFKRLPLKLRHLLDTTGGHDHSGDFSRQDSSIISSILALGISPEDTRVTFLQSVRGKHCIERKDGHIEDYVQRTIKKAMSFLKSNGETKLESISVNFGPERRTEEAQEDGLSFTTGKDIIMEKTDWLWRGYIPLSKITILAGDPGMGKSTIVMDLIARITRGTVLPTGERTMLGSCLIASAEDSAGDTIGPRLIAAGCNMSRLAVIRSVVIDGHSSHMVFPRDLDELRKGIMNLGARLVVIDPLSAFLERGVDSYKDQDIRSVLAPVSQLAEDTKTAILVISHLTKREEMQVLYRVSMSIGFTGAARSVLAVAKTKTGQRVLYVAKSNLAKMPKALRYETRERKMVRDETNDWKGEESFTANTIKWRGTTNYDPNDQTSSGQKSEQQAADFLELVLLDAPVPTEDVYKQAREAGIRRSDVTQAKIDLDIQSIKKGSRWFWKRPEREL